MAAAEGHEKIVSVLIEHGGGIGVRDIQGKTALNIATEKGYTAITQLLRDRAEGRKLVCSISHIDLQAKSEGGNFEHLQRRVYAGTSADTDTDKNINYRARMFKITAKDTLQFH